MRTREEITKIINNINPTVTQGNNLILEVLLDIRDLLQNPRPPVKNYGDKQSKTLSQ